MKDGAKYRIENHGNLSSLVKENMADLEQDNGEICQPLWINNYPTNTNTEQKYLRLAQFGRSLCPALGGVTWTDGDNASSLLEEKCSLRVLQYVYIE